MSLECITKSKITLIKKEKKSDDKKEKNCKNNRQISSLFLMLHIPKGQFAGSSFIIRKLKSTSRWTEKMQIKIARKKKLDFLFIDEQFSK